MRSYSKYRQPCRRGNYPLRLADRLRNSKIAIKAVVPLALMTILASGLVAYAMTSLDSLAKQTRVIVDVDAV